MCDSVVALGAHTRDGIPLFAKNSDRKPGECQPFVQHPEAAYPPGARLRCTHIEIPQIEHTYRVMGHSPEWVWGFEHGVNEHAVAIGNHTVFSKEPLDEEPGLIGMDLVRLGLERGRSARQALDVIASLIEAHGQGGAAFAPEGAGYHNSFLLADPDSAWVLETSNRHWAARRVELTACTNHYGIRTDWDVASADLEAYARDEGWWAGDDRLDVGGAFRNPHVPGVLTSGRQRRAAELLETQRGRHDLRSFEWLLRDHDTGGPVWSGARATPEEEHFFTLCAHSDPVHCTTASMVAPLPRDASGVWPLWISFAAPCSGIFLPVYVEGVLPAELARGGDEGGDARSAWQSFERLSQAVASDPARLTPRVRADWAALEARIQSERSSVEEKARAAVRAGQRDVAASVLTEFMVRTTEAALDRAEQLASGLA